MAGSGEGDRWRVGWLAVDWVWGLLLLPAAQGELEEMSRQGWPSSKGSEGSMDI